MLKRHNLAPSGSRVPRRIGRPSTSLILTVSLVKVVVQPSSQSWPMLTRLLVNLDMMCPWRAASEGKLGMLSCAAAMKVMHWLVAVLMVMGGASLLTSVMHACGMK
jgi:hypothetical protein